MRFDYVEKRISNFFRRYGHHLAANPVPYIVFPLLFTIAMAAGFLHLEPITDAVYLFTPVGARSKMERLSIHEKWPLTYDNYIPGRAVTQSREVQVTALSKNSGNILDQEYAEAVYRLDAYIRNRIRVYFEGRYYSYNDLCLQYKQSGCPANKHVHLLSDLYKHGMNITFPYFRFGTEGGYLGGAMGGVTLSKGENGTSILAGARAWFLIYHLKFYPQETSYISGLWEKAFADAMREYPEDPYITITYFHSQTLSDELKRNADSLVPRFVIAFTLLIVFSCVCSICFVDGTLFIDWVLSKPMLSFIGVINAGMGIVTAIGGLLLIGVPYSDIVSVMPFLVVAVGTDNMFLMVASIRRTPRSHSVGERMAESMAESAVSIFITSSTDMFSFGVGTITSIPAVQIFCIYTGTAIFFAFLYQITFFAGFLALFAKYEAEGRNSLIIMETTPDTDRKISSIWSRLFNLGSRVGMEGVKRDNDIKEPWTAEFFGQWYAPLLMNPVVKGVTIVWFAIYLYFAYYGCTQLKEGLEPINLLVEDSYAIPHYKLLQDYFWKYGVTLQVVVNNPPDLRDKTSRERILAMVGDLSTTRHSIGLESTQFWMFEMERYYKEQLDMTIVDSQYYGMLQHYLASKKDNWYAEDLIWGKDAKGADIITAFRLIIGMKDVVAATEQQDATKVFREVCDRWPEYNVTTFMPLWLFTDQYDIVVPNTVQNIVIALLCMILIAFILIPQPLCAFWVALACASIDFGVIGYMTLWDVKLDAISMITIIMSIGFSVDYAAHITYGYVVSRAKNPSDKVKEAISALGWPLVQGAMSTIIAVSVLADVPAYMIVTFFKTVVLAITIGLVHGLIFLPVFLSMFVRGFCIIGEPQSPTTVRLDHLHAKAKVTPMVEKSCRFNDREVGSMQQTATMSSPSLPTSAFSPSISPIRSESPAELHNRSWGSRANASSPEAIGGPPKTSSPIVRTLSRKSQHDD